MQAAAKLKDPERGFPQEIGVILECNPQVCYFHEQGIGNLSVTSSKLLDQQGQSEI